MGVTSLEINRREPFDFGYERIDGVLHLAADPTDEHNRAIVDLERAARDATGRVPFRADFTLLQPADPARGNRRLLLDVPNRGRRGNPMRNFNRAPADAVPTEQINPGDGWLFRQGWTVGWVGWQWDVVRSPAQMGLEPPQALGPDGQPIAGQVMVQFQPNEPSATRLLADRVHHPYPAADPAQADAVMTVRDWVDAPSTTIPREKWWFADEAHVALDGGFEPGRIYEVIYRTRICPVVGTGLLAYRDCASFLRYGQQPWNPAAGRLDYAFGFGVSQSGRFLRHFLYLGLNVDEAGRPVFDGLLPHVAGGRRGEFNHRYAQPSVQATRSFGHLPPFHDEGLLARQRAAGSVPKVIYTNTSAEYWRGDASLLHTDEAGTRDLEPAATARAYLLAGTQHGAGTLPLAAPGAVPGPDGSLGAHGYNVVDYTPLMRAALTNLDAWATRGVEPPASKVPRLADGTAARPADVLERFRSAAGATVPDAAKLVPIRRLEPGPEAAAGVGTFPPKLGEPYPWFVSAVDEDGNEVGGIRLPELSVPVASYTGWNPRHPTTGGTGQIMSMQGSTFPLPADEIGRRYGGRAEYERRVRLAAEQLAAERYVLPEDVEIVVANALARYDAFAGARTAEPARV